MEANAAPIEDFRAGVRQMFGESLRASEDLLQVGHEIGAAPDTDPLSETVRQLLRAASNSMRSVLTLVECGCGTDALKISRTMFEMAVNIHYLHSHPETLQDYLDFQWIKKKRHRDYLLNFAPTQAQRTDDASMTELTAEYARVSPRFTGRNGKIRSHWHKSNYQEVARSVGGEIIYGGVWPFVSSLIHMDVLGLIIARGPSGEVEAVPSDSNLTLGLQIGVLSYAMALFAADEILKANTEHRIQSAFGTFRQSFAVGQTRERGCPASPTPTPPT